MLRGIWKGPGEDLGEAHGIRREDELANFLKPEPRFSM